MKTKSHSRSAANGEARATVEDYFAGLPDPARAALHKLRAAIRGAVPAEATEVISYKIPAFKHNGILVWYAAFSSHCSLFPTASVIKAFEDELKGFSTSKGTVHFPLDKRLPTALIKRMVKFRVTESASKGSKKRG
jgi:uncharacterized protein YdhG (YjbR/CyaY superfamily)